MLKLNLPSFDYKIKQKEGKLWIHDMIRKKYVVLTPEEWVRQHFIHFLINEKSVPGTLLSLELGHKYQSLSKRCDITVWSKNGTVLLITECKATHIPLNHDTVLQLSTYYKTIPAPYLALSNGIENLYFQIKDEQMLPIESLPSFNDMMELY